MKPASFTRKSLAAIFFGSVRGSDASSQAPDIPQPEMKKTDISTQTVQGIPMADTMMATYAAYYVGANMRDPTTAPVTQDNTDLDGRATNVFNMEKAMADYFGKPDSPFLVLDDSNRWNERHGRASLKDQRKKMGNAYFVTLYHKASGKIMIAAPGLEGDTPGSGTNNISQNFMGMASRGIGDYGDVLFNAEDTYKGSTFLRATRAMKEYIGELDTDLKQGSITIANGTTAQTLGYENGETIKDKLVLAGHSGGTLPAMTLTGLGFKSFLVEPRAHDRNLEHRLMRNLAYMSEIVSRDEFRANLQQNQTSLRASWGNVWTSGLATNGEFHSEAPGKNYVAHRIGTEKDTMIGGTHREEVMTPGLLNLKDAKGYKGQIVMIEDALPGQAARDFGEKIAASGNAPSATPQRSIPGLAAQI